MKFEIQNTWKSLNGESIPKVQSLGLISPPAVKASHVDVVAVEESQVPESVEINFGWNQCFRC